MNKQSQNDPKYLSGSSTGTTLQVKSVHIHYKQGSSNGVPLQVQESAYIPVRYKEGSSNGATLQVKEYTPVPIHYKKGSSNGILFEVKETVHVPIHYEKGSSAGVTFEVKEYVHVPIRYEEGSSAGVTFKVKEYVHVPVRYEKGSSTGVTFEVLPSVPTLIDLAIQYTAQIRREYYYTDRGITEPLTPKARRSHLYLTLREAINRGCREACKHVLNPYRRTIAYNILIMALNAIFTYGKRPEIIQHYNKMLDELVGQH